MKKDLSDKEYYHRLKSRCLFLLLLIFVIGICCSINMLLGIGSAVLLSAYNADIYRYIYRRI